MSGPMNRTDPLARSMWVLGCSLKIPAKTCSIAFAALGRLAFFSDDLSVGREERRDCLGVARVVGLGKGLGGEPDCLGVLLLRSVRYGGRRLPCRAWHVPLPTGPLLRSLGNRHRDQPEGHPAMVKILRMGRSLSC